MSVSLSFACTNTATSTGRGFDTQNQLSGSTTTVITRPPQGITAGVFQLTCTNQNLTASAQCVVQVNQPWINLLAIPNVVTSGASAIIGWVTSGMQSCTIASPDNPAFTLANANNSSINGVAQTGALTAPLTIALTCQTLAGGMRVGTTTVSVR